LKSESALRSRFEDKNSPLYPEALAVEMDSSVGEEGGGTEKIVKVHKKTTVGRENRNDDRWGAIRVIR